MKKIDLVVNIFISFVILTLFGVYSFYKMKINYLDIIIMFLLFSFINSFIIKNNKLVFDSDFFSFQAITTFLTQSFGIFSFMYLPEEVTKNYEYIKLLFFVLLFIYFIFLFTKSKNSALRLYFCIISFFLIVINDIFGIEIFYLIPLLGDILRGLKFSLDFSGAIFKGLYLDIFYISIFLLFLSIKYKEKKIFFVFNYIILCLLVRYITMNFSWGN